MLLSASHLAPPIRADYYRFSIDSQLLRRSIAENASVNLIPRFLDSSSAGIDNFIFIRLARLVVFNFLSGSFCSFFRWFDSGSHFHSWQSNLWFFQIRFESYRNATYIITFLILAQLSFTRPFFLSYRSALVHNDIRVYFIHNRSHMFEESNIISFFRSNYDDQR